MDPETVFVITIIITAVIIIIAAWRWEMNEMHKLENKHTLDDVPGNEQVKFLQQLACFSWTEGVSWRRLVIASIIATFLIWSAFRSKMDMSLFNIMTVAVIIIATFMVIEMFRSYHWDRQVCMKASPSAPWF